MKMNLTALIKSNLIVVPEVNKSLSLERSKVEKMMTEFEFIFICDLSV